MSEPYVFNHLSVLNNILLLFKAYKQRAICNYVYDTTNISYAFEMKHYITFCNEKVMYICSAWYLKRDKSTHSGAPEDIIIELSHLFFSDVSLSARLSGQEGNYPPHTQLSIHMKV